LILANDRTVIMEGRFKHKGHRSTTLGQARDEEGKSQIRDRPV